MIKEFIKSIFNFCNHNYELKRTQFLTKQRDVEIYECSKCFNQQRIIVEKLK